MFVKQLDFRTRDVSHPVTDCQNKLSKFAPINVFF